MLIIMILFCLILFLVSCSKSKISSKNDSSYIISNDPCSEKLFEEASMKDSIKAYKEFKSKCGNSYHLLFFKAEQAIIKLNDPCSEKLFDDASWEDSIKAYKEFQSKCIDKTNIYYKKAEKEIIELKSTSTSTNRENIAPDLDPCRKSEYLNAEGDNYFNRDNSLRKFIENCNDPKNKYYLRALKKIDEPEIKVNSNIRKPVKEEKKIENISKKEKSINVELSRAIVIPMGVLGNISPTRQTIIYNKFLDEVSNDYDLVSQEEYEKAEEEAFQQLDYEECTEDQCIVLIQEFLQVENLFKIQLVKDEGDIQVSLTFIDLDKKLVKTDFCEGCKTSELIRMINSLYQELQQKR